MNNRKNAEENIEEIMNVLESQDVITDIKKHYSGSGVAEMFGTEEDVILLRLGRRHSPGYEDSTFNRKSGISGTFFPAKYTVFLPLTAENINNIKEGKTFQYAVANRFEEDQDGWISGLDQKSIDFIEGNLDNLKAEMPKKCISRVSNIDVKVGDSVVHGVRASNPNDYGDVLIYSLSGMSSLFYNSSADTPFKPHIHWGSFGWKEPTRAFVQNSKLYFDDDAGLWHINFVKEGYDPVKVKGK
ncbi:hypothetical protein ACFLZB_02240 [Nanoarchaeota archaeon]